MATVDVVVVAYNSRGELPDCLAAARAVPDVGEVVVVDHGSDGSAVVAEEAGARAVAGDGNRGFGAGQNRGLRETASPFVLMLNPDAVVVPDAVGRGVAHLRLHPDVAAVQGVIVNRSSGRPERSQGVEVGTWHLLGRAVGARRLSAVAPAIWTARRLAVLEDHVERVPEVPRPVETLAATALLVRRSAVAGVGGFDESYFLYGEDLDLCRRLRRAGWRLVALPDVWATHLSGASAASRWDRELHWWRGTMQFATRWWSAPAWSVAVAAAVVRWTGLAARRPRRAVSAWGAVVGAALVHRRQRQRTARPGQPGSSTRVPHLSQASVAD